MKADLPFLPEFKALLPAAQKQLLELPLIIIFILILSTRLSAVGIRIDGIFDDWEDVKIMASDPQGDAKGAFDISGVYAASQGTILYLRFDTGRIANLQNGLKSEGTLLVVIDLPDKQQLIVDTRGRRAYLNDDLKERISWEHLKYVVGPTYAQNEFEIQIDLGEFGVNVGDSVQVQFDGSDKLDKPFKYILSEPAVILKRRSSQRQPGTDVRVVSLNTFVEGLSDPDRADALGRLLNSVDSDIYCFQEEWKTTGVDEIMNRLLPPGNGSQWYVHKVRGNVIASKYPLKKLQSKNNRFAIVRVKSGEKYLFVINAHLSAMGYIDSKEDKLRIQQANEMVELIDEIHSGKYNENNSSDTKPNIVIVGDFNLVGSRTPLDLIVNKKAYGLTDWLIPNLIGESVVTWRGGKNESFAPGKLDYVIYSEKTLVPKNGFILDSGLLDSSELKKMVLETSDSKVSDHLLMAVDFQFKEFQKNP